MNTPNNQGQPLLIIVNGPPASGKSTLAEQVAAELGLPYVSKDALKEELFDSLGVIERTLTRKLGEASMRLLYTVAGSILDAGTGVVIEANFYHGVSEDDLSPIVARARAMMVHCDAPEETIKDRYVDRAESGERHPVHGSSKKLNDLEDHLEEGTFEPLALDIPVIRVDTTNGYDPSVAEIVSQIRSEVPVTRGA
jgi:predicted kinase